MKTNQNPRTLFTADHHFGHASILRMGRSHFTDIDEHDEMLVTAWNAAVRPGDEVWHLGDFCYRCPPEHAARIFARLNGTKRLVVATTTRVPATCRGPRSTRDSSKPSSRDSASPSATTP